MISVTEKVRKLFTVNESIFIGVHCECFCIGNLFRSLFVPCKTHTLVADPKNTRNTSVPPKSNFFHFYAVFWQNICQIIGLHGPRWSWHPFRNSRIRHCVIKVKLKDFVDLNCKILKFILLLSLTWLLHMVAWLIHTDRDMAASVRSWLPDFVHLPSTEIHHNCADILNMVKSILFQIHVMLSRLMTSNYRETGVNKVWMWLIEWAIVNRF